MATKYDNVRALTQAAQCLMELEGDYTLAWGLYLTVSVAKAEELAEIARVLAPVEKQYSDGHLTIRKMLDGGGYIDFACYNERVMFYDWFVWECPKESILQESRPAEAADETEPF